MNEADLRKVRERYPLGPGVIKLNSVDRERAGACSVVQDSEVRGHRPENRKAKTDDAPQNETMDGISGGKFRVSITLLVADARDRDPDGATSTLLDCILDAAGRLLEVDRTTLRKLAKIEERRRGSHHHD